MYRLKVKLNRIVSQHKGTTLIEVIVCFMLLSIFMVCASILISSITSMYYNIKGEIYSREVSDIMLQKITSELDGAEYFEDSNDYNPSIKDNNTINLCDKTDTYLNISAKDGNLVVHYYDILYKVNNKPDPNASLSATDWEFDDSVLNGFELTDLKFYVNGDTISSDDIDKYGLSGVDLSQYDKNVVLVLMSLHSDKYEDYYYYKFVKMYDIPKDYAWPDSTSP